MESNEGSKIFGTVLSAEEWSQVPSEIAKKIEAFAEAKFEDLITSKALYETKKAETEQNLQTLENELTDFKSKYEDSQSKLDVATSMCTSEVSKLQETSNRLESTTAEFRRHRQDYEQALQIIGELTKHNENMIVCSDAKKLESRALRRENDRMKKEITDLSRQVCFLLKEVVDASRTGSTLNPDRNMSDSVSVSSPDIILVGHKKELDQLKEEYETYKKEKCANENKLVEQVEQLRKDHRELTQINCKLTSLSEYNEERFKMLEQNTEVYKNQINALEEMNSTIMKHEQSIMHLKDEALQNIQQECRLLRDSEARLLKEKEIVIRESKGQSLLLNNLEMIKASLERSSQENTSLIANLKDKVAELEAEQAETTIELTKTREELQVANEELTITKENLESARNEVKSLSESVQIAEDKYAREMMLHSTDLQALATLNEGLIRVSSELNEIRHEKQQAVETLNLNKAGWEEREKLLQNETDEIAKRLKDLDLCNKNRELTVKADSATRWRQDSRKLQNEREGLARRQQERERFTREIETLNQRISQLQRQLGLPPASKPSTSSGSSEKSGSDPPTANMKPMTTGHSNSQQQSAIVMPCTAVLVPVVPPQQQIVHTTGNSSIEVMSSSPISSHTDYMPAHTSSTSPAVAPIRQVAVPPTQPYPIIDMSSHEDPPSAAESTQDMESETENQQQAVEQQSSSSQTQNVEQSTSFMNNKEGDKMETVEEMKLKRKRVVECGVRKRRKSEEVSTHKQGYPKRNIAAKNYVEDDEIPEDRYVYCDECMHEYLDSCDKHTLRHVPDNPVPVNKKNLDRAKDTVPTEWLEVKESRIKDGGYGIWALREIRKGIQFGPYEGVTGESHMDGRYSWQIKKNGRVINYINGFDTSISNWMRYVNCARNKEEQNLMAFQYRGQIYYRSVVDIPPHTELLVFYGAKFAKELGIGVQNHNSPPSNPFPENVFKCENCYLIFCSAIYLEEHVARCTDKYVAPEDSNDSVTSDECYECKPCSIIFIGKSFYDTHNKYKHNGNETTSNGRSSTNSRLDSSSSVSSINTTTSHTELTEKKNCTKEKSFKCTVCSKAFTSNSNLEVHTRIHTGEKPYKCTVCNKQFPRFYDTHRHQRTHTGEKPYACTVCKKQFARRGDLYRHQRGHTGEKPYACNVCNRRFTNVGNLRKHERIHRGENPY